jgi:hypothetical protein
MIAVADVTRSATARHVGEVAIITMSVPRGLFARGLFGEAA